LVLALTQSLIPFTASLLLLFVFTTGVSPVEELLSIGVALAGLAGFALALAPTSHAEKHINNLPACCLLCCNAGISPVEELFSVGVALAGLAGFALALALVEQVVLETNMANVKRGSPVYESGHVST
jgi:hypothetical protein